MARFIILMILFCNTTHAATTYGETRQQALQKYLDGHFAAAEDAYKQSLATFRKSPDPDLLVAITLRNLAAAYTGVGRYAEAMNALREASRLSEASGSPILELKGQIANSLGVIHYYKGNVRKAEEYFKEAGKTYERGGRALAPDLAQTLNNLAEISWQRHDFEKAESTYKQSLALTEEHLGPSHPDLTVVLENLADLYAQRRRHEEAIPLYRRSLAILDSTQPTLNARILHALHGLSKTYLAAGKNVEAERLLARAAAIVRPNPRFNHEVPAVLETYSRVLKALGRSQEAQTVHGEASRARVIMSLTVRVQDLQ